MDQDLSRVRDEARTRFGYTSLRQHQEDVLSAVLSGRDGLAVLPTGGGKSLCYALPAVVREGIVLVVSPLVALMRDQERRFTEGGVRAATIDSLRSREERDGVFSALERGEIKLLLVSPERLARIDFRERLASLPLQLVAVDEAHCVSHWGNHFRPDYRQLGEYLHSLARGSKPLQKLALTATATRRVREDVMRVLGLVDPKVVIAPFSRDNLTLKIARANKVHEQFSVVLQAVLSLNGPGIVYAPTRKLATEIQKMLTGAGERAVLYHAGLSAETRQFAQRAFMSGERRVVVATNAFGMGIDKADIRFVIHAALPSNIEQYVQEIGRAGRDGEAATCILVYSPRDFHVQRFMLDKSFPEAQKLSAILRHARELTSQPMGFSEEGMTRELLCATFAAENEVRDGLTLLCREGLLSRLRASDSGENLVLDGNRGLDQEFWRDYPQRKADAVDKLEAMRAYAVCDDRLKFLDDYFNF